MGLRHENEQLLSDLSNIIILYSFDFEKLSLGPSSSSLQEEITFYFEVSTFNHYLSHVSTCIADAGAPRKMESAKWFKTATGGWKIFIY